MLGLAAIFVGHHAPFRFAAHVASNRSQPVPSATGRDAVADTWSVPPPEHAGYSQADGDASAAHARHARRDGHQQAGGPDPWAA